MTGERVMNNLTRMVLIMWFLVVLILTQSYTASLASMLTVQKLQPTVTDVNLLIKNNEYVGYMQGSFVFGLLKKMRFDESRLIEYDSPEKLDELLAKGSGNGGIAAAFHEKPYIKLFLGKYCSKYTVIGPINKANGFGIVFPIGSPLVTDVSRAILNVTEGKKMVEIERKWLGDMKKCSDSDTLISPKNLGLGSFWGLFLIVVVAGVTALVIHVARFVRENWNEVAEESDRMWHRIVDLLKKYDTRDLRSHTFKKDAQYGVGGGREEECGCSAGQSPVSAYWVASPRTNGPPSPAPSSPVPPEIELVLPDRNRR